MRVSGQRHVSNVGSGSAGRPWIQLEEPSELGSLGIQPDEDVDDHAYAGQGQQQAQGHGDPGCLFKRNG